MAFPRPKPTTMETLAVERADPPFNVRKLAIKMHGSERALLLKEKFMAEIARHPAFKLSDIHDLSKEELRERTMEKFSSMVYFVTTESLEVFGLRMQLISMADPSFWTRFGVAYGLFLGALRGGATPNQFSYWIDKGVLGLNGVIGCFAMTELAHGSNVAGLETTATFDRETDEFIIHTPHLGATKWWIGGAASTATHAAVFAQMIIDGKKHGVKTFVTQLRDTKTFQLLPGITIGDIGKKMGRDGIDNGYIQFTYVRVPRAHMLMKHTQVSREGAVTEPLLAQLTYGALLAGRTTMVTDSSTTAKKALTIAIRYAAVRRQFSTGKNEVETQLLDYPIHQRRLIPLVAQAVAIGFTGLRLTKMYEDMTQALDTMDPSDPNLGATLDKLKETHSTSAGLKAFCTWACLDTIDKCRQSCGGHGYSAYSNFPGMYADFAVQCTWEGDNTILSLQAGRSLVSAWGDAMKGKKLVSGVAFLNDRSVLTATSDSSLSLTDIQRAWHCVAANVIKKAAEEYLSLMKDGKTKEEAMEACSQSRFVAAKVHVIGYIFGMFREAVEESGKGPETEVLESVCKLYGLWQIEEQQGYFLKYGYYTPEQIDKVQIAVSALCADVRTVAVPLVDSFALSDHILNSPLGKYDGSVYESYFAQVQAANPTPKVHPYFERLIRPLLERQNEEMQDPGSEMGLDEELGAFAAERKEAAKGKLGKVRREEE
ncbi:acyl-CoA oxidase [Cryptococcus wingfieldii CBS 7118]|uniref:Acyl-coenzyme A oxidase n=1 Tax=Cryptococcus wingfieldii CBS 7118 TaxID=1295528 RepID=A0A1E3HLS6_9TREE|nr:acyl-CoA oxidase [Cryptococcus wingfieldii CBS 7118]ODN77299.1 acyl-CoA oxidase [Cryptococcus wingfieldii CBS 7118]